MGHRASTTASRFVKAGRWLAGILLLLLLLSGLLGYLWLPGFAKLRLETLLSETLHRPVSIERVTVSPYALSVAIEGFKAGDVLSVARLYLDVSSASLLRGMPVVSELRVEQPRLHLVRDSAGRLNIADLLTAGRPDQPDGPPPAFAVSNILLQGGQVELEDRGVGRTQRLSEISLAVPFITTADSRQDLFVEPRFSARLNGAALSLSGRLRPFAAERDGTLELILNDLELLNPMAYARAPLVLHGARLETRLKISFSAPRGKTPVLTVTGDAALQGVKADLLDGRLQLRAGRIVADGIAVDLARQHIGLKSLGLVADKAPGLALRRRGAPGDFLRLSRLGLRDLVVDMKQRRISVAEARLDGPSLNVRRTRAGSLDLAELIAAGPGPKPGATTGDTTTSAAPWSWSLAHFILGEGRLAYADDTLPEVKPLTLTGLSMDTGRLANDGAGPVPVKVGASVNGRGRLDLKGRLSLQGEGELLVEARQVDLVALQGWVVDRFNVLLTRGELGFKGRASFQAGRAAVTGDLTLGNVNVLDRGNAEDLLRWKRLRLARLSLSTAPLSVQVGEVALNDFFAEVLINEQGQLNLRNMVKAEPAPVGPAPVDPVVEPTAKSSPADIRIGRVRLSGGEVNFTDRFIRPNYSARLTNLEGRVDALVAGTLSSVELQGNVDGSAPLKIQGRIDPLSSPPGLDIQASARGIDMPGFSAYSGRYVGYAIEKGKLSLEVKYKVEQGQLTAENKLFLDQLTFGEKVESPDALSVPVNLAVALLKNSRGEIDIHLPISGSLDDPQFSVGGIVVKMLVNLVVKAVTSPFALLGSLFGGGEDLSHVIFTPGQESLTPETEARLQALAKAMADRPALTLEVSGRADPEQDKAGIKRATLDRKIRARKLEDQARRAEASASLDEVAISAAEYPVYLEKVYQGEKIPDKPRNLIGLVKSLPSAEMEARLLAAFPAGETELHALAEQRGRRIQSWLLEMGKVPAQRVFLLAPRVEAGADKSPGNRVDFSLR